MPHEETLDDLRVRIEPLKTYVGRKIQHRKTDGWYRVTGIHFLESDMNVVFSYETLHHPQSVVSFIRPISELLDGRFTI